MLAVSLIVVVIAQDPELDRCEPGMCGGTAMVSTFRQAMQRVLGSDARVQTELAPTGPADDEVVGRAGDVDGVVELSFSPEGQKARLHCYLSREKRWLDREISFGESHGSVRSEITERGRLLGFAAATMYAGDATSTEPEAVAAAASKPSPPSRVADTSTPSHDRAPPTPPAHQARRMAEFSAIVSSGLGGTASGLGASAGFRWGLTGPIWGRVFIAGRSGNIPEAQASTRTGLVGGGLALALLPESSPCELGARLDTFAGYFEASHLSEDDVVADSRSRWQLGGDLMAEVGWRPSPVAGLFLGAGIEVMFGETAVYTHHTRVAVVPPFRATAELGFRTRF